MEDVALHLDPVMIDDMRREAETHGFDHLDAYVQWLLERRETVLDAYDARENPPGVDDADPAGSSGPSPDDGSEWGETLEPEQDDADPEAEVEDVDLPEEDGADDDDVAAALEDLELDDEE